MDTLAQTVTKYENIIATNLKVNNPILLKTGALGTMANIFANLKYDANLYYSKLVKEMNPATAEDFSSFLFHSSILGTPIIFANPATFDISFIVPDINIVSNQLITYTIQRQNAIQDTNGYTYTLDNDIDIYITGSGVQGKAITSSGVQDLKVDKIPNPNLPSTFIYLVTYTGLKQYKRQFSSFTIPDYNVGDSILYNLAVQKESICGIRIWYQPSSDADNSVNNILAPEQSFYSYDSDALVTKFGLNELNIKYTKYTSSQYDNDIFLNIKDNIIEIQLGDGYNGQKRSAGETLFVEILTTNGAAANLSSNEWVINKVLVTTENDIRLSNTSLSLKAVSLNGGTGGKDFLTIEELRSNMLKKSRINDSIITPANFRSEYTIDGAIPYIDTKYLNSKSNVFIYNVMRDSTQSIIYSTTLNLPEVEFDKNLFFPTATYNGIDIVSPFLYRKLNNQYNAYLIQPEIKIDLQTNESNAINRINNLISAYITYDYVLKKSKIEIRNYNDKFTYIFRCNLFTMTLNKDNNFMQDISTLFTDEYCLIDDNLTYVNGYAQGLTDIRIDVINEYILDSEIPSNTNSAAWSSIYVMNWYSQYNHFQTKLKQSHFFYIEPNAYNTNIETRYVMHLPYIDNTYFTVTDKTIVFEKMDSFFQVIENQEKFPFNVDVSQSLYNTIAIDTKYIKYLFDINNSYIGGLSIDAALATDVLMPKPKFAPIVNIIVDKILFSLSDYQTIDAFETELNLFLSEQFSKIEGFQFQYFESSIESLCLQKYNIIKNIEIINPKSLTIKSDKIIYADMETDLGKLDANDKPYITLKDIVDFVPPYFYFDLNNIFITILID